MSDRIEEMNRKKKETEEVFKNAFCANTAEVLMGVEPGDFKLGAVVKLESKDRGTFFISHLEKA